jgi:D-alanyl-D-alanine carboxypeptidase (penicillin-binding protein 5/6)
MSEQAARLLDYGFALTPGRPVGQLVDQAPPPEMAEMTPGAIPASPPAGSQAASRGWTGGSSGVGSLVPVALWISLAIAVLAVLGALVARQRHR